MASYLRLLTSNNSLNLESGYNLFGIAHTFSALVCSRHHVAHRSYHDVALVITLLDDAYLPFYTDTQGCLNRRYHQRKQQTVGDLYISTRQVDTHVARNM